jgi:Flp pilus assembly protein TadG
MRRPPLLARLACRRGSTAVEMALLAWPTILLVLGALQLILAQYTQALLSNALFDSAAAPETELTRADAATYRETVCSKIVVMPAATCRARLLVEMTRLADAPTAATAVAGTAFTAGSVGDALLLRAALPNIRLLPAVIPNLPAKASVVFRR